eukprot:1158883-Pelagomonas_calceolata.AAC.2
MSPSAVCGLCSCSRDCYTRHQALRSVPYMLGKLPSWRNHPSSSGISLKTHSNTSGVMNTSLLHQVHTFNPCKQLSWTTDNTHQHFPHICTEQFSWTTDSTHQHLQDYTVWTLHSQVQPVMLQGRQLVPAPTEAQSLPGTGVQGPGP